MAKQSGGLPPVQDPGRDNSEAGKSLRMTRGVSQLLFTYLPGRTVDWEDGVAIVQLGNVYLDRAWDGPEARVVLDEVGHLLERWESRGGSVDRDFPNPRRSPDRFVVGTPKGIDAYLFETAYVCQRCRALAFPRLAELRRDGRDPLVCPACHEPSLRQFPQVFVHGCGELRPLVEYIPGAREDDDGDLEPFQRRIRCPACQDAGVLELVAHSERIADMKIICRNCRREVLSRIAARCPRCVRRVRQEQKQGNRTGGPTSVTRTMMRMSRYSANDTYYPQTITLLRLDQIPAVGADPEQKELAGLLPSSLRPEAGTTQAAEISQLSQLLQAADVLGDDAEKGRILALIAAVASGHPTSTAPIGEPAVQLPDDVLKGIRESLAFRAMRARPGLDLFRQSTAGSMRGDHAQAVQRQLGLREITLVEDLPVITATFGYTRRSFEPQYIEGTTPLPTGIRMFPSLNRAAANRLGHQELQGAVPILAREGDHQGLFLSLDPTAVVAWLEANEVALPERGKPALTRILAALEPIDRYYDEVWGTMARRYVFGLVHSLSHAAMRATSHLAGLERTSLSEYLFLPLLGTVVFDTAGEFQLGGIETMVRDHLATFLENLSSEAVECLYDTDCIDTRGACHGCIHSPEIACRVFNHGLSRAFLIDGHAPWADISDPAAIRGFWPGVS